MIEVWQIYDDVVLRGDFRDFQFSFLFGIRDVFSRFFDGDRGFIII